MFYFVYFSMVLLKAKTVIKTPLQGGLFSILNFTSRRTDTSVGTLNTDVTGTTCTHVLGVYVENSVVKIGLQSRL